MPATLAHLNDALLAAAEQAGAPTAEAIAIKGASISIDVRDGGLEQAERSESTDIGLRVLIGRKQAIVSASDTRPETITALAERAVAMAQEAPEDPHVGLAEPDQLASGWDLEALELADPAAPPEPEWLSTAALECEAAARAVDGVSQVQSTSAAWGSTEVYLSASNGFAGQYRRTSGSIGCAAIAGSGTGMERDYDGDSRIFRADLRDPAEIGQIAGQRASARLGARKPPTGQFPVLFDERIAGSLIGHLLSACNGAVVARGSSWLRDRLDQPVLPDTLSLTEDPFRPRCTGSRPFDGEGLPTRRRAIVDGGRLTGWTLDLASARKLGMTPTGNAARGLSGPPAPTNWNVTLTQGSESRADLLGQMGTGLLVTSLIGMTINPTTGDYSRGASGFWVENGEITYPVNECTIAGNLHDMLRGMRPGNDARPYLSLVVPSVLIEGMTIAGN